MSLRSRPTNAVCETGPSLRRALDASRVVSVGVKPPPYRIYVISLADIQIAHITDFDLDRGEFDKFIEAIIPILHKIHIGELIYQNGGIIKRYNSEYKELAAFMNDKWFSLYKPLLTDFKNLTKVFKPPDEDIASIKSRLIFRNEHIKNYDWIPSPEDNTKNAFVDLLQAGSIKIEVFHKQDPT